MPFYAAYFSPWPGSGHDFQWIQIEHGQIHYGPYLRAKSQKDRDKTETKKSIDVQRATAAPNRRQTRNPIFNLLPIFDQKQNLRIRDIPLPLLETIGPSEKQVERGENKTRMT